MSASRKIMGAMSGVNIHRGSSGWRCRAGVAVVPMISGSLLRAANNSGQESAKSMLVRFPSPDGKPKSLIHCARERYY